MAFVKRSKNSFKELHDSESLKRNHEAQAAFVKMRQVNRDERKGMKIIPVIHVLDEEQVMENAAIAAETACYGVFLISMDGSKDKSLICLAKKVKDRHPELKVGVNHLTFKASDSINDACKSGVDMVWTDQSLFHNGALTMEGGAAVHLLNKKPEDHFFKIFGACDFKYQIPENDPAGAALANNLWGIIPTTSGAATGNPPEFAKIEEMLFPLDDHHKLAIASGVNGLNAFAFQDLGVDYALVATGISDDFYHLSRRLISYMMHLMTTGDE